MEMNLALVSQSVASSVAAVINEYAAADDERKQRIVGYYLARGKELNLDLVLHQRVLSDPRILAIKTDYSSEGKALGAIVGGVVGGSLGGAAGAAVGATIGAEVGSVIGEHIPKNSAGRQDRD
ncbi:glycine zipper domain-containing protein [Roseovarius atlanticus]|uniref:glycine zipper domain-containing protein n=1 Tax=Roseovarius atlanticus TaxID=1641875 RepID=UPI0009EBE081|nr:glycine zipper domain-containing protein [Roseovarius atlanticus]